jgi:hypothetical protein
MVHSFSIFVVTEKSALCMLSNILLEVDTYKLPFGSIRSVASPLVTTLAHIGNVSRWCVVERFGNIKVAREYENLKVLSSLCWNASGFKHLINFASICEVEHHDDLRKFVGIV